MASTNCQPPANQWSNNNLRLLSQGVSMNALLVESTTLTTLSRYLRAAINASKLDIKALGQYLHKSTYPNQPYPSITQGSEAI